MIGGQHKISPELDFPVWIRIFITLLGFMRPIYDVTIAHVPEGAGLSNTMQVIKRRHSKHRGVLKGTFCVKTRLRQACVDRQLLLSIPLPSHPISRNHEQRSFGYCCQRRRCRRHRVRLERKLFVPLQHRQ